MAPQGLLVAGGLGVGAHQDRAVAVRDILAAQFLQDLRHFFAFALLCLGAVELYFLAGSFGGPEFLFLAHPVVSDDAVGGLEDSSRRTVVFLQTDDLSLGVVLLEIENVFYLGPAPAVDGLVVVAHRAEVPALQGQKPHQLELDVVGVLVFVHQSVKVALLIFRQDVLPLPEKLERQIEQVFEIDRTAFSQSLFVIIPEMRNSPVVLLVVTVWLDLVVGGPGFLHLPEDLLRIEFLVGDLQLPQSLPGHHQLVGSVVDAERGRQAEIVRVLPYDPQPQAVEGRDLHVAGGRAGQSPGSLRHLGRGLVGESDRQNVSGSDAVVEHVGDAVSYRTGLARTGSGKHQNRAFNGLRRLPLTGIQTS